MTKRLTTLALWICTLPLLAQEQNVPVEIRRAPGAIVIDGDLGDAGWQNAARVDKWYETNPGDNIEPSAKSVGYLAYDDHFFYAAFEFSDPNPSQIRAPFNDRDNVGGNTDDYGGVILDTRNDRRTAVLLLTNARGIQYDAITDDASGEDSSPDFFWDSAARITATGWTLEMRVPFSSLRYFHRKGPQEWGILLYRNMPRDRRYQMFSGRLPRGGNCFICHRNPLVGLTDLPTGGHLVAAPYMTAQQVGAPRSAFDRTWVNRPFSGDGGLDLKWTPNVDTAVDATINPDFSQVESDVAAISTNERFAIFYPEKRPFFLEGVELFSTPIQAAYTRTVTSPRWGLRTTGKRGGYAYTLLVAQDRGGGDVVLPSREGSDFAFQDFQSTAVIGRARRDFGTSFVSGLATLRESEGGAHNRVLGPDFRWQIGSHDTITGQLLHSDTVNPNRPDVNQQWNGRKLSGLAGEIWWSHSTPKFDAFMQYRDFGDEFRADNGFVPQVGFRLNYAEVGYTVRPEKRFFNRIRSYAFGEYDSGQNGDLLYRLSSVGFGADGGYNSFTRLRYARDGVRTGNRVLDRDRLYYHVEFSPRTKKIARLGINGWVGDEIDFVRSRLGRGASIGLFGTLRPTNHLQLGLTNEVRWLNIEGNRLFTSQIERVRATYTFNSRMFVRAIVQNTRTNLDRALYERPPESPQHVGDLATQFLYAYKLNWQTVMYVGISDLREVEFQEGDFEASERQLFMKLSYAFQR